MHGPSSSLSSGSALPGLGSLYRSDLFIQRGVKLVIAGIVGALGVVWATQPSLSPPPGVDLSFEQAAHRWAPVGGAALVALGATLLAWRYLRIRKIFSQGITVKGTVTKLDVVSTTTSSDSTSTFHRPTRQAYFATVSYAVDGVEREACLRIPNAGFVYGLAVGRETDLVVLEWAPTKPLIRSVYFVPTA